MRDVDVFLTLADELHFGRTAERLHLSQARVSQVVRKLERAIGAALFERTTRTVSLTPSAAACARTSRTRGTCSGRRSKGHRQRPAERAGYCGSASSEPWGMRSGR